MFVALFVSLGMHLVRVPLFWGRPSINTPEMAGYVLLKCTPEWLDMYSYKGTREAFNRLSYVATSADAKI